MPRIKMSPDFRKQQSHFRFEVYEPKSCGSELQKVENLRRQLDAIRKQKEEALAIQDRLEFLSRGILVAGLIKETCYSFLDLAVAIGADVLPEPMGKQVELVGNAGMAAIDMTETSMDMLYGQAGAGDLVKTSLGAAGKFLPAQTNLEKALKYGTSQNLEMADVLGVARKGDPERTRQKIRRSGTDMAFDTVILGLDTLPENTPGAKHLKTGVSTAKAAKRYSDALEDTFDRYLDETEGVAEARFAVKQRMRRLVDAAEELLDSALREFNHCMAR